MWNQTLAVLIASFALAPGALARQEEAPQIPEHSLSEIVLQQYRVQHVDPDELYALASDLVGRSFFVKERGGPSAHPVSNLRMLGDGVIVYDTPEQVKRVLDVLKQLDVARESTAQAELQTIEYRPRFVTLDTAFQSLRPFGSNVSAIQDRGILVIRDRRAPQMLELLGRIDVPARQILVTCYLIEALPAEEGTVPLPKELVDHLQKLLPSYPFSQIGMALLRLSVGAEKVALEIDSTSGATYHLAFRPIAFDPTSAALTIEGCSLVEDWPGDPPPRELFSTNTMLRGGEYTALAATGSTPLLLVVRMTPLGG